MYQIRKGWPAEAAIDEVLLAKDGASIEDGMIVSLKEGKAVPANYTDAAQASDPLAAFVIGKEGVAGTFTGLMSQAIMEVDTAHYEAASYKSGDALTAKNGKFAPAGSSKVLARVMTFDAASGLLRLMWHEAR